MSKKLLLAASTVALLTTSPAFAASDTDLQALRTEIQVMRQAYENKIEQLEQKVEKLTAQQNQTAAQLDSVEPASGSQKREVPATHERRVSDNSFNPSISAILQGKYSHFSSTNGDIAGFAIGEEGERGSEGLSLDETELNFSANVDDKFYGSATFAIVEEDGASQVELEEAYIQTTSLPHGLGVKAGRFFAPVGYLNELHAHSDDFADRPLTHRAFLNKAFNDDGIQGSWIAPLDLYTELGLGVYRGHDFPAGDGGAGDVGAWNPYIRFGGDFSDNTSWRLGGSALLADSIDRAANEDAVDFSGDSDLYALDARMIWAPTGNNAEEEVILQGEYFRRSEDGTYDDTDAGTGRIAYDDSQDGFYLQSVYKFDPQWRIGARYSQLFAGDTPAGLVGSALDDGGHDPWAGTAMLDWTNSEFGRLRLQYNREELADNQRDDQVILQYIMSIGAHGAHPY